MGDRVKLQTGEFQPRVEADRAFQGWVAEYGDVVGFGSTRAAALRDLADRLDVTEAINATADPEDP